METKFTISEALSTSWQYVKTNIFILVGLFVGFGILYSIFSLVLNSLTANSILGMILGAVVSLIISSIFSLGYLKNLFQALDDEEPQLSAYKEQMGKIVTYVLASIIVSFVVTIGMFFLILPGIYLALRFQFFAAFIVEENASVIDSLKRSWEITNGQTLPLLWLMLAMIVLAIVGMLLLGVGLLIACPVIYMMYCYVFRKLNAGHEAIAE